MAEYGSTDEGSETDRRLEAGSAASLRAGNDAPPPGATSRGLRDGRRSAGERSGGCQSLDCSEAECREQARVQKHSRIAVFCRSRVSADAWSSGECRRRPDPEIPRSGSGGTGGREMVTRTSSRTAARCRSVDSVIWSPGTYVQSRARLSPIEPKPEDTESQAKARGGRAAPGPPPSLEERSRRRTTQSRSPEDPGGRTNERERSPSGPGTKKPSPKRERREQRKTKQVAEPAEQARLMVCGAERASMSDLNKKLPPNSVYMGRSRGRHGNPGGSGNPFRAKTRSEECRAAALLKYKEYLTSPSGRWLRYRFHELVEKKCFCHCSVDEMCHVDEVLKVMGEEQEARSRDDRPPDLNGMSPAEVGLALKSHLLAPRSGFSMSAENFVLRHTGVERGGGRRETFSPFRSLSPRQQLKYRSR